MGGGNCLKYLKRGGTKNRTEDKKILLRKGGGKLGQGVGLSASRSPNFLWYSYVLPLSYQHQPCQL